MTGGTVARWIPNWNVLAGSILIAIAMTVALHPDYPIARDAPGPSSAFSPAELMPAAVAPIGDADPDELRFTWAWPVDGVEAWDLVVMDDRFVELARQRIGGEARTAVPSAEVVAALVGPGPFHWSVTAVGRADLHSGPIAFELR